MSHLFWAVYGGVFAALNVACILYLNNPMWLDILSVIGASSSAILAVINAYSYIKGL